MWQEIRLSGVGVIDEAVLELGPGLSVLTGETGAGKTMVVTALGLLRGGRADSGLVRTGAARCRVEARVSLARHPVARSRVDDAGGDLDDGDELLLARTVSAQGRSRAYVGGAGVPASTLASVSDLLVAVHGQDDQHRLLRPAAQRDALDRFAGPPVTALLADYRPRFARWRAVGDELAALRSAVHEREKECERLRTGLTEIEQGDPQPGEDGRLRAEEGRLAHAEALRTAAQTAHAAVVGDDADAPDAAGLVSTAQRLLDAERMHDQAVAALADRASGLAVELVDLGAELAGYASGVDGDPLRLSSLQDRRAELSTLVRRYGDPSTAGPPHPGSPDSGPHSGAPESEAPLTDGADLVLEWGRRAARRLADLEGADERVAELAAELDRLESELLELAWALRAARREAAGRLAREVAAELAELAMPHAVVEVRVAGLAPTPDDGGDDGVGTGEVDRETSAITATDLGPLGADDVEVLLAPNPGAAPRPLSRGASGGERSRVMLALEVVLADPAQTPTFVFDEVDAGIGGRAAVEVGRRLARLARTAQVLAVTHLPQVAAFADHHHRVHKSDDGSVTTSGVQLLDADSRVDELSRMLAGLEESETARAHAREMLDLAAAERAAAPVDRFL